MRARVRGSEDGRSLDPTPSDSIWEMLGPVCLTGSCGSQWPVTTMAVIRVFWPRDTQGWNGGRQISCTWMPPRPPIPSHPFSAAAHDLLNLSNSIQVTHGSPASTLTFIRLPHLLVSLILGQNGRFPNNTAGQWPTWGAHSRRSLSWGNKGGWSLSPAQRTAPQESEGSRDGPSWAANLCELVRQRQEKRKSFGGLLVMVMFIIFKVWLIFNYKKKLIEPLS